MTVDNSGLITWTPPAEGIFPIEVEVSDGQGGVTTQAYDLTVITLGEDTEVPTINLGFSGSVFEPGQTLDLQIQGFDNVGLADLDLSLNGESLALAPDIAANGWINNASITLNEIGVFEAIATATDLSGNQATKTRTIRVIDPTDTEAPIALLDLSGFDPTNPVIDQRTDISGTINDANLEFYRLELAPVSLIDLSNPTAYDPDFITIAEGTANIDGVLGTIDPNLYRDDNYYLRLYAQDVNGQAYAEGVALGITSQNKPGDFSLDYTDLSVPVGGLPLVLNRQYSSLRELLDSWGNIITAST